MRIGAHVSIAGGLCKAVARAVRIGAECTQIFVSSPQTWAPSRHLPQEVECFRVERQKAEIYPIFLHTIYLVNLASPDETLRRRSVGSLVDYLRWAEALEADGVVTHLGSGRQEPLERAEDLVVHSLREALGQSDNKVPIYLETSAGGGNSIGSSFEQLGRVIRSVAKSGRLGVCLDTAHIFAAGYDITSRDGVDLALDELDRHVGIETLGLVHANDSKTPMGSRVDRHENIGRGFIGEQAFRYLLQHPALQDIPFIIEVPGFNQEGPDAENIALLRTLAQE